MYQALLKDTEDLNRAEIPLGCPNIPVSIIQILQCLYIFFPLPPLSVFLQASSPICICCDQGTEVLYLAQAAPVILLHL